MRKFLKKNWLLKRGEGQLGSAQAEVIRQRLKAEADGLTDKLSQWITSVILLVLMKVPYAP